MAMPTMYEQLSWFALGGVFGIIGAWGAFRLEPWWLYAGILVLHIGVYIGLIKYDEAVDNAQFIDLLIRAFGISKKRITKLGATSTNLRDALNLAKQRDIVIAPRALVANSSPVFCPPDDATGVIVITAEGDQPQIAHHKTDGKPFKLT